MTDSVPAENPSCKSERNFKSSRANWIGLAVVAVAFAIAAALTWRKWPDIIVDYGIQLYIPWRLLNGAVLYRDIFYFSGGPFSQYFNALLFKIFGVSFLTLVIFNLAAVAAMLLLVYRRFLAAADALTATTICLGIVLVFAFGQYTTISNYTYAAPYSHEALHGLILSIFAVAMLSDWLTKQLLRFAAVAGFCAGLVFLTKPDFFFALTICSLAAFVLHFIAKKKISFAAKSFVLFFTAGILPPFAFFLFFLRVENWHDSLRSVVFGWLPLFHHVVKNPFYQWCLGFDEPLIHLREIAIQFFALVLIVAFYAAAFRFAKNLKPKWQWILFLALVIPLLFVAWKFDWSSCGSSLPLLSLAACVLLRRNFGKFFAGSTIVFPLLWSIFGLVLLLKLGFFPRIWHYGFTLAMPAFAGAIYLLLWLLPRELEKNYRVPPQFFRTTIWLALMTGFLSLFLGSQTFYHLKNLSVGRGADKIIAVGPSGNAVEARSMNAALDWIEKNIPPHATLAALPQGTLINFLSRRVNPTPCLDWNPTMFSVFGQSNMTAAFEKSPPDYICVVEWPSYEFGLDYFGKQPGYGVDLMQWIGKNYQPVFLAGSEPLKNGLFGIKILKRKE